MKVLNFDDDEDNEDDDDDDDDDDAKKIEKNEVCLTTRNDLDTVQHETFVSDSSCTLAGVLQD